MWQEEEEEDVRSYWMTLRTGEDILHLKEEALDRTMWRHHFGGGFGPVVRQNTEWINEYSLVLELLKKCRVR